jgi:hypothetical protein
MLFDVMLSLLYVVKDVFAINAGLTINYGKNHKLKLLLVNLGFHHDYEGFTSAQRLISNYHHGIGRSPAR